MSKIKLKTSDVEIIFIAREIAIKSKTIAAAMDCTNHEEIHLTNVHSTTMKKIIDWLQLAEQPQLRESFVRLREKELLELGAAAIYLMIDDLSTAINQKIAALLSDKSTEEMKSSWNIK